MKRKRGSRGAGARKRPRTDSHHHDREVDCISHPILQHYYPSCLTLRQHLEEAVYSVHHVEKDRETHHVKSFLGKVSDQDVRCILDQVIVARNERTLCNDNVEFKRDLAVFTQQLPSSSIGRQTSDSERQQIEVSCMLPRSQPFGP